MELTQYNHLKIIFNPDPNTAPTVTTTVGSRPQQDLNFRNECIRAAKAIQDGVPGEKIALLLDETYESAVLFLAFLNAGIPFEIYFIEYRNLAPQWQNSYNKVEQWTRSFGVTANRICFDFNDPLHLEGLEKLQISTSCSDVEQLFKIWASCDIDNFLVVAGSFVYPIFGQDFKVKQWNLPGYKHLGLLDFFEKFGGVPFFFSFSAALVYSQVDSEVSNHLIAITEGNHRNIVPGSLAIKKKFAEQAFPSELANIKILEHGEYVQMRALRGCGRAVRSQYFNILKNMHKTTEALIRQNVDFQSSAYKRIITEQSYRADLVALSQRSDLKGNIREIESTEQFDHKLLAAFSILITSRDYKSDTTKVLDYVKTLEFFKNKNTPTTNTELHEDTQLANLVEFFNKSIELYFEEMSIDCQSFEITHCWANRSGEGEAYHHFHYHPNSFLSGVFYLTSGGGGNTVFKSEHRPQLAPNTKKDNMWNILRFEATPEAGKLILFPSHLDHKTEPHTAADHVRYSIAFNVIFKGWTG